MLSFAACALTKAAAAPTDGVSRNKSPRANPAATTSATTIPLAVLSIRAGCPRGDSVRSLMGIGVQNYAPFEHAPYAVTWLAGEERRKLGRQPGRGAHVPALAMPTSLST